MYYIVYAHPAQSCSNIQTDLSAVHVETERVEPGADELAVPGEEGGVGVEGRRAPLHLPTLADLAP